MTKLRFLVSLITEDNDYQLEQAAAARRSATELDVDAEIIFADNDPITQSTQVIKAIQADASNRPNGIIVQPVGATSLGQAAKAATNSGVGWALLSRRAEYAHEMRNSTASPVFSIGADQMEIGRIQARLTNALLPRGGAVLFIQGPSVSSVSRDRLVGLQELLPGSIHLTHLRGRWTEESAYQSVCSWIRLTVAQKLRIDVIVAQNDLMGTGAKRAIEETVGGLDREDWLRIPIIGCDGVPKTGQAWVRSGLLAATVIIPPNAGQALVLMTQALKYNLPIPEHSFTVATAFPTLDSLSLHERRD